MNDVRTRQINKHFILIQLPDNTTFHETLGLFAERRYIFVEWGKIAVKQMFDIRCANKLTTWGRDLECSLAREPSSRDRATN